jgi:hypothetical protein
MMKLWVLQARYGVHPGDSDAYVVRTSNSRSARELASIHARDIRWKDREFASCELVRLEIRGGLRKPAIILASPKIGEYEAR